MGALVNEVAQRNGWERSAGDEIYRSRNRKSTDASFGLTIVSQMRTLQKTMGIRNNHLKETLAHNFNTIPRRRSVSVSEADRPCSYTILLLVSLASFPIEASFLFITRQ